MQIINQIFPLGQTVITAIALDRLNQLDLAASLERHASVDWGDLYRTDAEQNERLLQHGGRNFSVYRAGECFWWIITDADRSVATDLMPEDY